MDAGLIYQIAKYLDGGQKCAQSGSGQLGEAAIQRGINRTAVSQLDDWEVRRYNHKKDSRPCCPQRMLSVFAPPG